MSVLQLLPAHVIEGIVGYVADEAAGASAKQLLLVSHRWRRAALRHINRECTIDLRQQKALGTITVSNKHETWSFGVVDGVVEMDSRAEELTANMAAHVRCLRIAVNVQDVFGGEAAKALEPAVRSGRLVCMRLRRLVFALGNTAFVDADPVLARSSAERLSCWVSQMAPRANDVALVETAGFNGLQKGSRSGPEMQQQSSGLHVELALRLLGRASHMDVCNLGPTYFADTWELGDRRLASIRCRLDDGGHMAQVVRSSAPWLKTLTRSSGG
ncbi:hypothetical protein GGI15_002887 [Coemansia interrupta]|uniref:Uncharacterized protein n=1 Tax=Coemansia interrupta TaxID=1126814 RepID=A0A9W8LJH2_9FUNG|nr:hypothetical protein GGI15_002887 [Coemansia interrupta]